MLLLKFGDILEGLIRGDKIELLVAETADTKFGTAAVLIIDFLFYELFWLDLGCYGWHALKKKRRLGWQQWNLEPMHLHNFFINIGCKMES